MLFSGAIVIAKHLLIEVTKQVEWFNGNISAFESPLYEAPEILQPVRVYLPVHVFFGVVNDLVNIFLVQSPIRVAIIGREIRTIFDVISYESLQGFAGAIFNNHSPHFAATLQDSADDNFVGSAFGQSGLSHFGAFVFVHESGLTADEGFVNFDVPLKFSRIFILHCESDSVKHEPCGFLSYSDCAVNLVRGNSILAVGNHPRSGKPFIESDGTVLKYGSYLSAELFLGVFALALPNATSRNEFNVLTAASWTGDTIGPTLGHKMIQAVVGVVVKDDCGLQGLGLFHSKTRIPETGYCVKYINTQVIPEWRRFQGYHLDSSSLGVDFSH
jgi:hypothetical protein